MKKVIALFTIACCFAVASHAQGQPQMTPEQRAAAMKERLKPLGLTDVQNDSVVAIYTDRSMMAGVNFRDMTPEDRQAKMKEVGDAREKRMMKAGISADQVKKISEMMSQRPGGGRPGGGGK